MSIPFDGIVTCLVFLIGLPALLLQMMTPEVRRAVMRQSGQVLFQAGAPFLAAMLLIGIAFWIDNQIDTDTASENLVPSLVLLQGAGLSLTVPLSHDQLWTETIFALIAIMATSAIFTVQKYGQRDSIIDALRNQASPTKRSARLNEKALNILIELGEQSAPGEDKELVLQALGKLVELVSQHPAYQGDSLETLATKLVDILTSAAQPGTAHNFNTAVGILQRIVIAASNKNRTVDLMYAIRALGYASQTALTYVASSMEIEGTLTKGVDSLGVASNLRPEATTQASEELFKLGTLLLEKNQEFIAVHALDTLLTLVWANHPARGELVADTLGLASHFWVDGPTARKYVEDKLDAVQAELAIGLREALQEAQKHCIRTTYFQTADNLQKMLDDLYGANRGT